MTEPIIQRLAAVHMCELFNDGDYWGRMQRGEFTPVVIEDRHPSLMKANEPYCTKSQMVSYRDKDNNEVVRVHQYLRPDKTIGASGRPDPKRLLKDGVLYKLPKRPKSGTAQDE